MTIYVAFLLDSIIDVPWINERPQVWEAIKSQVIQKNLDIFVDPENDDYPQEVSETSGFVRGGIPYRESDGESYLPGSYFPVDNKVRMRSLELPYYKRDLLNVSGKSIAFSDQLLDKYGIKAYPFLEQSLSFLEEYDAGGKIVVNSESMSIQNVSWNEFEFMNRTAFIILVDANKQTVLSMGIVTNIKERKTSTELSITDSRDSSFVQYPNRVIYVTNPPQADFLYEPGKVYPFLNTNLNNTIVPSCFGYCYRVLGVCLNEEQAMSSVFRHFLFSDNIISSLTDGDFILEANIENKWVKLPRNQFEYEDMAGTGAAPWNPATMQITVNSFEPGTVSIPVIWAHRNGNPTNGLQRIRLSAWYTVDETPSEVIRDYFNAAHSPFNSFLLNLIEPNEESLKIQTGFAATSQADSLSIIEQFQSCFGVFNRIYMTANELRLKMDNPNKALSFVLRHTDIFNENEFFIEFQENSYATDVTIHYAYDNEAREYSKSITNSTYKSYLFQKYRALNSLEINCMCVDDQTARWVCNFWIFEKKEVKRCFRQIEVPWAKFKLINILDIGELHLPNTKKVIRWENHELDNENDQQWLQNMTKLNKEVREVIRVKCIKKEITSNSDFGYMDFEETWENPYYEILRLGYDKVIAPTMCINENNFITIVSQTPKVDIFYTTDGTTPLTANTDGTINGTHYYNPIMLQETTTIKAIAIKEAFTNSDITTETFII